MRCDLSYNKYKYGQKVTRSISDVSEIYMKPGTNKLVIITDIDNQKTNHTFEVNDTLKIEVTAEDI